VQWHASASNNVFQLLDENIDEQYTIIASGGALATALVKLGSPRHAGLQPANSPHMPGGPKESQTPKTWSPPVASTHLGIATHGCAKHSASAPLHRLDTPNTSAGVVTAQPSWCLAYGAGTGTATAGHAAIGSGAALLLGGAAWAFYDCWHYTA
jgi:hypothetical protein